MSGEQVQWNTFCEENSRMNILSVLCTLVLCLLVLEAQGRFLDQFKRAFDPMHNECGIEPADRQPCGRRHDRIGEIECKARSCCWAEDDMDGESPGCFIPKRMLKEECGVKYEDKDDCGYHGITEGECLGRDCCYRPSPLPNDPDCFHKKYDSVRLVGGPDDKSGRVEVQHDGEWGTVCDDLFGEEEATVICKSLGYELGIPKLEAKYGEGSGTIWLDSLMCKGKEEKIEDCRHDGWGVNDCGHGEDAGVQCLEEGESPDDDDDDDDDDYGSTDYNYGSGYESWDYRSLRKPSK